MKTYISLILLLLASFGLKAQINISYSICYGNYSMSDMKDVAKQALDAANSTIGIKLKQTDNFPSYIIHTGDITFQIKQHEFGFKGAFLSTGAKYAYSDYSGKYNFKINTNAFKLGLVYKYHFSEIKVSNNPISFFLELAPSVVMTDLKFKEEGRIYEPDIHQNETENVLSDEFGFSIQPMIGARLTLFRHFFVLAGAGYDFEFGAKLGPSHRVDWSGFRLNGGIGVSF